MLLNANVRQVHVVVVQLCDTRVVLDRAESTKTQLKQVRLQWPKRRDQHIEPQIELLPSNQQRIVNVPRNDVALLADLRMERRLGLSRPLLQLRQLVDQKYPGALRLTARLHNPRAERILAVLLDEHVIVSGQHEGDGYKVQVQVLGNTRRIGLHLLGQRVAVSLQILAVSFDVLHQQILAGQLVMVGKVIDDPAMEMVIACVCLSIAPSFILLIIVHSIATVDAEDVAARLCARPIEIPVLVGGHLQPAALLKVVHQHRLVQVGAKVDPHTVMAGGDSTVNVGQICRDLFVDFMGHRAWKMKKCSSTNNNRCQAN
jgi:hypothetical protein